MANSPEGKAKAEKTGVSIGLSSLFATLSTLIPDETLRQVAVLLSPPLGHGVSFLIRNGIQYFNHKRACRYLEGIIAKYEQQLNDPNITTTRRKEIQKILDKYTEKLEKTHLDNLNIKFE
ncbi:hypothetical protein [Adhaeribacter aquaticus]|uniref:hypothetical protein n=1 Tax=Adhaeribacter aquaticus TaxID=299567 RepID=UPI00047C77EB|nr:hypothetical protein [Adhaeribacter aquaticus]